MTVVRRPAESVLSRVMTVSVVGKDAPLGKATMTRPLASVRVTGPVRGAEMMETPGGMEVLDGMGKEVVEVDEDDIS